MTTEPETKPTIGRILRNHARLKKDGRFLRCTPSTRELHGETPRLMSEGTDGKIIYDSRRIAKDCAAQLAEHYGVYLREYPCQRSRHGHFHLTTDYPALRDQKDTTTP